MEDEKIIALYFARNEQAVKETDTAYGRKLYVLSNHILNNREDAEESVSDTYMEAWKSIPPKRPKYFYAFLAAICRNVSFDRLDWRMAAKRNAEVVALTQEMENCIPAKCQSFDFGFIYDGWEGYGFSLEVILRSNSTNLSAWDAKNKNSKLNYYKSVVKAFESYENDF